MNKQLEIAKLLKYQEIDMEIYKAEQELNKSEEKKKATELHLLGSSKLKKLQGLCIEAEALFEALEKTNDNIKALSLDKIMTKKTDDLESLDAILAQLDNFKNMLTNLENEYKRVSSKILDIKNQATNVALQIRKISEDLNKAKAEYNNKGQELSKQFAPTKIELNKLEKEIATELLDAYKIARESRIMPALVEYKDKFCSACGMDVGASVGKFLIEDGDFYECTNCRRLLYLKK